MKTASRTFKNTHLHGKVAHDLGKRIVSGELAPGDILPNELSICKELSVSRTALREAYKVLTAKGLIQSKPRVGARIQERESWNMLDPDILAWSFDTNPTQKMLSSLRELRSIFEPSAARIATERQDSASLTSVALSLSMLADAETDSVQQISALMGFHQAVLTATQNEFLNSLLVAVETEIRATHSLGICKSNDELIEKCNTVYRAIINRDGREAFLAMGFLLEFECSSLEESIDSADSPIAELQS